MEIDDSGCYDSVLWELGWYHLIGCIFDDSAKIMPVITSSVHKISDLKQTMYRTMNNKNSEHIWAFVHEKGC